MLAAVSRTHLSNGTDEGKHKTTSVCKNYNTYTFTFNMNHWHIICNSFKSCYEEFS